MTHAETGVLAAVAALWNAEPEATGSEQTYRTNNAIKPAEVLASLSRQFSGSQIESEIANFVERAVEWESEQARPARRDVFLLGCCLRLVGSDRGVRLPVPLVQRMVHGLPVSLSYDAMRAVIAEHLDRAQMLQSFLIGLRGASTATALDNSLSAILLYSSVPVRPGDPRQARIATEALVAAIEEREVVTDPNLRQLAERAKRNVSRLA